MSMGTLLAMAERISSTNFGYYRTCGKLWALSLRTQARQYF